MLIAPTFNELKTLAVVEGVELDDVRVIDAKGRVTAEALMHVTVRRHHGLVCRLYALFNGRMHDYSAIAVDDATAWDALWREIVRRAHENGCDAVVMDNVLAECVPTGRVPVREDLKIFDVEREEKGWSRFYNRKSVKRFCSAMRKIGAYHVEISDGVPDRALMEELRTLHIRRWGFSFSKSAFALDGNRVREYCVSPANKHYMRVMIGKEIVACHYGMRYGDALLWHTPVINPKYIDLSPLRVLLAETARYCEAQGLCKLDFGLGDEHYKDEYCNESRKTCSIHHMVTARGRAAAMLGWLERHGGRYFLSCGLNVLRHIRHVYNQATCHWLYYESPEHSIQYVDPLFVRITNWMDYCDFLYARNLIAERNRYERFKNDTSVSFVALADSENVYSYGWESTSNRRLLCGHSCSKDRILFDFITPKEFRGMGYYTRLLRHLVSDGNAVIYVSPKNLPSKTAIEHAGFVKAMAEESMR